MNKFHSSIFFLLLVSVNYGQTREKSFTSYYIGSPFYILDPLELVEDTLTITRASSTNYLLKAVSGNEKKIEADISFIGKANNKGITYNKYSGRGYLNEEPKNLIIYSEIPLEQYLEGKGHILYSEEKLESFLIHFTHSPLWEDKDYPKERMVIIPIKEKINSYYQKENGQKTLNLKYLNSMEQPSSSLTGIYTTEGGNRLELLELEDGKVAFRLKLFNGTDLSVTEGMLTESQEEIYSTTKDSSCPLKIHVQGEGQLQLLKGGCRLTKEFDFSGVYKLKYSGNPFH